MSQISAIQQPVMLLPTSFARTSTTPTPQDDAQAKRAADSAARAVEPSRHERARRAGPELAPPTAPFPGAAGLATLLPTMAGQHPAMVPGATAEAFVRLHRTAAVSHAGAPVQAQARLLIGLATPDGQLAYPTPAQMRALAGTGDGLPPGLEPLHAALVDAPALREAVDELAKRNGEEPLGLNGNSRTDYVLLLVSLLMKMGASQREQAVAMVHLAVQSLTAMTDSMVSSAKATQSSKIATAVVGGLVAAGGVGIGGVAAYKGVQNLRTNKTTADVSTAQANHANSQTAVGMNTAPAGPAARPPHVEALRQRPQALQEGAAVSETEFAVNNTYIGVMANAGQAVTQTGVSVGAVAGSPMELEATAHTVDSERDRINKDIEVEIGSKVNQDANKTSESQQAMFNTLVSLEQDNHDAVKHVIGNMRR